MSWKELARFSSLKDLVEWLKENFGCSMCSKTGKLEGVSCPYCDGKGHLSKQDEERMKNVAKS